jgi:hypothetical protein
MHSLYDRTRFSDSRIRLMSTSATLAESNVSENTFANTQVETSRPAHIICFVGSSTTAPLTVSPPNHGNELEWFGPWQLLLV